ncbi:hypothetical protein JAAARDRAFT_42731 [Jaapia argillacea MUCL 33604]|uniref:Uncharacterized protein n=1 Tax=Jaapia argillacea MUCL 33604 TaxID=933084 RepID=A0A067P4D0_9AGAM|nr:hypothetical protein JAAARDRAFT_42731 [Jaapia argillacea MUCL 33604]
MVFAPTPVSNGRTLTSLPSLTPHPVRSKPRPYAPSDSPHRSLRSNLLLQPELPNATKNGWNFEMRTMGGNM